MDQLSMNKMFLFHVFPDVHFMSVLCSLAHLESSGIFWQPFKKNQNSQTKQVNPYSTEFLKLY